MRPSAAIESNRMSSLTSVSPTYQRIERPPIHHVALSGVW